MTQPDPDTTQAFLLHSRPSAAKKIFLDFRGCNVTGTAWNSANYRESRAPACLLRRPCAASRALTPTHRPGIALRCCDAPPQPACAKRTPLWQLVCRAATIFNPPYDIDGNTAAFSTQELSQIVQIWRGVAEDYAPFNVDVTTEVCGTQSSSSHLGTCPLCSED